MKTLVKYATRERPEIFKSTLSIYQRDPSVEILVSIDEDDATMTDPKMIEFIRDRGVSLRVDPSPAGKIRAMNYGIADYDFDFLIMAQDDMIPQYADYAQRAWKLFVANFPDGDGNLHLFDGRREDLNTGVFIDRDYFDRFGYVYHPQYISLWADDEFMAVAKGLGRYAFVRDCLIKHEWTDRTGHDALHAVNESFFGPDERTFRARKAAGFPLAFVKV